MKYKTGTRNRRKMNKRRKQGDTRKDGYRFGGYNTKTLVSGEKKKSEKWYSPESYLKLLKSNRNSTNKLRLKDPEKHRKAYRDWQKSNPEKHRERNRKWRLERPEMTRNNRLKRDFGISLDEYNKKLKSQKNGCAICKQICTSGKNLAVDHCHTSGMIRGLLCGKCNLGLGLFKDDIILLANAKRYLVKHSKVPCLKRKKSPLKSRARSGR